MYLDVDGHVSPVIVSIDNDLSMKDKQDPLLTNTQCQLETINNFEMQTNDNVVSNSSTTDERTSVLPSIRVNEECKENADEQRSSDVDEKEIDDDDEEKEKKEEEKKKKNNSSFTHDDDDDDPHHASGIILVNDEPGQIALLPQEKKERERTSSSLPVVEEQSTPSHRTEDESIVIHCKFIE